jgi:hypothetical protein
MKIRYYVAYFLLAVMMIAATGITVFLLFRAYNIDINLDMIPLEFSDNEEDLSFAPVFDENYRFIVNPYKTGNPKYHQAAVSGAFLSFILKEVKIFVTFAAVLAVLALIAYVITAFIVLNRIFNKKVE